VAARGAFAAHWLERRGRKSWQSGPGGIDRQQHARRSGPEVSETRADLGCSSPACARPPEPEMARQNPARTPEFGTCPDPRFAARDAVDGERSHELGPASERETRGAL